MAGLIKSPKKAEESYILNRWFYNRMIERNQNVLLCTTGGTGSGKSYLDLRIVESWYQYKFKKEFPIKNCCFSIGEIMKRLSSGELKRGEILILEEAGVNMGSLDFHNKVSKLFGYVLQSFRSMNIGIIFNLPVLTMLNKSARYLIHGYIVMNGIDYQNEKSRCKIYFRQVNQKTGKIYDKYLKTKVDGKVRTIKKYTFSIPPKRLVDLYEAKKLKFVTDFTEEFSRELDKLDRDNLKKLGRKDLTHKQQIVYEYLLEGLSITDIAEKRGISKQSVYETLSLIRKKGYETDMQKIAVS